MEYLFDFSQEDASEMHSILGFIDADFSMTQLKPYLKSATQDIVSVIGSDIYEQATTEYTNNCYTKDELVYLLKYAIALGAFRKFIPLSDVSYTTSGRLFRTDENTKAAFEWMIDKSDDAMERSYYSSVNEILRYIYKELPALSEAISKSYKLSDLFVSDISIFQEVVSINDCYLLYFKLIPEMRKAQNRLLKSRMGEKYTEYKDDKESIINDLSRQICVYYAIKNGLQKESVQLWPKGIIKEVYNSKQQSASQFEISATVLYYEEELGNLLRELENAIAKSNQKNINGRLINFGPEDNFVTL